MRVLRLHSFVIDDVKYEALAVTINRSSKLDVWASAINPNHTELEYRGRFTPDHSAGEDALFIQIEAYVVKQVLGKVAT